MTRDEVIQELDRLRRRLFELEASLDGLGSPGAGGPERGRQADLETLRKSEEMNRAIFERSVIGISHKAVDGHWLHVNDALCGIVGYSSDERADRHHLSAAHPSRGPGDRPRSRAPGARG